jgi:hypothetical protein
VETNYADSEATPPRSKRRRWRWAVPFVVLAALGLGIATLGGVWSGSGSPSASSDPSNSTIAGCSSSGCSSSSASASLEAKALSYAGCMRSHGLTDFPDPTVGSNGLPSFNIQGSANSDLNPESSQWKAAQSACKNDLPDLGGNTSADKEAANVKALKYAQCMRSHGEPNFPDPNGQGVIQITNATGILSPNSPQYQQAETACQSLDNGFSEQGSARS